MRLNLKMFVFALVLAPTILLTECSPPSPAPAATATFQHESYRQELMHREQMIDQGRAVHVKKEHMVV